MKKIIFLIIALLPILGFSQVDLVRWNGANLQPNPALLESNISAGAISGNFVTDNYSNPFSGFRGSGYNNSTTTPDYDNYMQFSITANSGYSIALNWFKFTHARGNGGPQKFEVRYSTDTSIGTSLGVTSISTSEITTTVSLTGITVASGTTLYIRVYPYNRQNPSWSGGTFHIKHGTGYAGDTDDGTGPTIRGTVSTSTPCTASTAPTTITGNDNVCSGSSITLTASGGTVGSGSTYEWGTGTTGSNVISGQTTAILTHTPTNASTTYWVRRKDAVGCGSTTTSAVTKTVTMGYSGDPTAYGSGAWIGYVYANTNGGNPPSDAFTTTYRGYVTQSEIFDMDLGTGAISGANLCGTYTDNFAMRLRMTKTFTAGYYTFTVGGDDGYRLSVDGGNTNILSNWNAHAYAETSATVYLNGSTNLVLEYFENTGSGRLKFSYASCTPLSTAPTSITGNTVVCSGTNTTLTASGGTAGAGCTYEWGTGSVVGSNIIAGQTAVSITVAPTAETTYWVRRVDTGSCAATTAGTSVTVTIAITGDPTVFGDNTWNVYGYNETSMTPALANYKGYYTQSTLGVNSIDVWGLNNSPSSASTWQGCSLANDNYTFIHKRKGFPAGSYELRMVNWDDNTRVYVDGVQVVDYGGWYGGTDQNNLIGTYCLHANSTIEIRTIEYTGGAQVRMNLVAVNAIYNNGWAGIAEDNSIEIQSDLVINSDLEVCTCTVKAGSTLTINSNHSLVVQDAIVVETGGTLIVENNANLVQINDTAAASNSGSIQVERESSPVKQYDYVYWSSPVVGTTMQTLSNPSMYYRFNTLTNSWVWMSASEIMQKGVGYIARVSNYLDFNGPQSPTVLATFNGAQHSGVVNVDVNGTNATKFNLVGNPYPSAIDAEAFILANASKITGTLYFWTHQTAISSNNPGSEAYNYTSDDYAKFNLVGGVGTGTPSAGNTSPIPNGYIPSCQGFYVETSSNVAQQLLFNNSMRVAGANTNNQFFKPAPTETDQTIYKHRVWLNISNTQGAYCETLLGYVTGATNELDNLYDGKTVPAGNYVSLYSILDTQPLAIQGRGLPFSDADIIPLGYSTTITGNLTISLGQFDGLFDGQDVFLVDKTNNVYTNLKDINYTFQTATGTFTDRFELRFVNETLGIENPTIDQNAMMVIRNGNQIQVKSNELTIDQVIVYDLQGRVIFDKKNINAQEFFTGQLNASNQVVIVKVIADNDAELVKKVIMN